MKTGNAPQSGGGFTLMELLIVIVVVGLLVALLVPVVNSSRESARAAGCVSNMRQIGVAMHLYASENQGILSGMIAGSGGPGFASMCRLYVKGDPYGAQGYADLRCPAGRTRTRGSHSGSVHGNPWDAQGRLANTTYCYNVSWYAYGHPAWPSLPSPPIAGIQSPSQCIWVYCSWYAGQQNNTLGKTAYMVGTPNTHAAGRNLLYADGRVSPHPEYARNTQASGSNGIVDGIPTVKLRSN